MQDTPSTPVAQGQRLETAKELQESILKQIDGSGLGGEISLAIVLNLAVHYVGANWTSAIPRGKVVNLMSEEFRDRLQKYLPRR